MKQKIAKLTATCLVLTLSLLFESELSAALVLNKTISDGMVLQQQADARIWGTAEPGKEVTVLTSWNGEEYSTQASKDGKWAVKVPTPTASYDKYCLTIKSGLETEIINDVLVGEVWMASGQSNMEMPIRGFVNCPVEGASEVIAAKGMLTPKSLAQKGTFETFPCFSADGRTIYYCSAAEVKLPDSIASLKYSLMKVSFNPTTGETGNPETIWNSSMNNKSVCHPKCSPDGKWLMFTVADYGTFPIWHQECNLALLNLENGTVSYLKDVNSDRSDTYHSWSSNSRWFVFASKRGDGQYGKPYLCHIDEKGECSLPFILPQKDPHHYDRFLKSYNIPDLGKFPVPFDNLTIADLRNRSEAEQFK